jgi:site-specific DNA recombinase
MRGHKLKKKLEIEPEGAETIRLIFQLYLVGDGASGPLGIKNIVHYLNDRGYKTPKGNRFHIGFVNKLLRDEVYVGRHFYNKHDSRAKVDRPRNEWILVPVPQIISDEDFQRVQILLTERSPKKTAPRLVNSPVLLTGVARCGGCRSLMVKQTGKGGTYSYYRCSGKQREGSCSGGAPAGISASVLDKVVLDRLLDELLTAERVQAIVAEVTQKRADGSDEAALSLSQLQAQKGKSTKKLENLIAALAEGIVSATDTFKATLKTTEGDCERLTSMIAVQERLLNARIKAISIEEARLVASELREKLIDSPPSLKKRIVRSFVDQVLISADEIVVTGAKSNLAEVVTGTPTGVSNPETPVPSFERAWWSRGESNP